MFKFHAYNKWMNTYYLYQCRVAPTFRVNTGSAITQVLELKHLTVSKAISKG